MSASQTSLLETDPFSLDLMADPLPYYRVLRDWAPVKYYPYYDTYFISRFEDVWEVLRISDNALIATETNLPTPEYLRAHHNDAPPPLASTNPMAPGPQLHSPYYEQMRQAHIAPLRPKNVARIKAYVEDVVRERLDILLPRKSFDIVTDYAGMTAATVICSLFGIPKESAGEILAYVYKITRHDPAKGGVDLRDLFVKLKQYIVPAIEVRREAGANGDNTLIDGLIAYRTPEEGRALSDNEIADQLVCVMVGGFESVAKVTAQGLLDLYRHPDQLAEIRQDLDANVAIASEEMIRLGAPAQYTFRTVYKELELRGHQIQPGQRVACLLHSAAHDEREFENPDAFIWNRPIPRVISFGLGQHHCIGKHLAQLEVKTLVREFLARVDTFDFDLKDAQRNPTCFQRGWVRLPVTIRD